MITIVTNIIEENNRARITSNVSSVTNSNSSSAGSSALRDVDAGIKEEIMKTMSVAMLQVDELSSDRFDKNIIRNCEDMSISSTIIEKDKEIETLKQEIVFKNQQMAEVTKRLAQVESDYSKYKASVVSAAKMLSGGEAIPIANDNNPVLATEKKQVVLNSDILNEAIMNKETLESRTCSQCGSAIIAPTSLHDKDVICTKCTPQPDNLASCFPNAFEF